MIGLLLFIAIVTWLFAGYVCVVEAWCEKDWPRKSIGSFSLVTFSIICLVAL
jgi:hypothetical protein